MRLHCRTFHMFFSDPIANTVSILRVAYLAKKNSQVLPISENTFRLLLAFKSIGFIESVHKTLSNTSHIKSHNKKTLKRHTHIQHAEIIFKYINLKPRYSKITLISKRKKRIFIKLYVLNNLVKRNPGIQLILSNSYGVMSHQDAIHMGQGGMLICSLHS